MWSRCHRRVGVYPCRVPKLWSETIEAHRREVSDAIQDTTAALVGEHGLHAVTMSQIAEAAGIGRATLYNYYADVEAILLAWHERQVSTHLDHLEAVRERVADPGERLAAVLEAYALIVHESREHHWSGLGDFGARLHRHGDEQHDRQSRDGQVSRARRHLVAFIGELVAEAATCGDVRRDVPTGELASYCLNAVGAAANLPSRAAVRRLVGVTLAGMRAADLGGRTRA